MIDFIIANFPIHDDLSSKLNLFESTTINTRSNLWHEYIDKLDWLRFMTGINLDETFYGYKNLHSSYVLLHARMGFLAFLLVFIFLFGLFRLYKINFIMAVCYLSLLLRGMSNTTFMSGSSFDFVL